ncbi:MAG: hypothetical protein JO167_13675 [Alphaproteobacteria bacterium]|nr:hypothetical protein [Alphaproteobacteria bacterium]MBV9904563.1 hypothetical protein [Alphaproteobacteria bacterium]
MSGRQGHKTMQERVLGAFKQVVGFLVQGIDFEAAGWRAFETEMRELIQPHMAVLVHRRAKLLDGSDGSRWSAELDAFLRDGLMPLLGDERDYAERNRAFVSLMLDVAIAEEQRRTYEQRTTELPFARSFDASWAS